MGERTLFRLLGWYRAAGLADKQARADAYLTGLAADPARVRQLRGWDWLADVLDALPTT